TGCSTWGSATAAVPYAIPSDSPFADRTDGTKRETWAYGLRNPARFSWDRATGQLWAGDVGQGSWEEIDLIAAGGNYGWNSMEGSHCYRPAQGCSTAGLVVPVVEYSHAGGNCSVTGGYVYRGQAVPALRGVYVFGDYCTGAIWGVPADAAERGEAVQGTRYRTEGPGMSSFAEDLAGELYMLSFDGKIYRAVP
ncbi:MAG: PQQ-dependent sugar dehydrogenase, partial [Dehalococcoidia bacterium]|nr:PQQ-dependent sugar dehydrogenase [Dehalococcoidia bacterium]